MGERDNALRTRAIPFRANWYDNTSGIGNQFEPGVTATGDLTAIGTGAGNGGLIRLCRPHYGDIVSAFLTLQATAPVMAPTELRFYKGDFDSDGLTALSTYSEARKAGDWLEISGFSDYINYGSQDNVFIDGLDISPIIPKRGDSDYNEDGFILGVDLSCRDPADWYLYNFKVDCIAQMGVQ